jgi:endoglucanase
MVNRRRVALAALAALAFGKGCQPQPTSEDVSVEYGALATTRSVLINLLGYAPGAQKIAVAVSSNAAAGKVEVLNSGGAVVWPTSGTQNTVFKGTDNNSGDAVHHGDFTAFQTVGTGYRVRVTIPASGGTVFESEAFDIGTDLLGVAALPKSAMKYYYYHRQGMALSSGRLDQGGSTAFAHSGLHLDDNTLTGYPNAGAPWSTTTFNVVGGWSDAGDLGK